MKNWLKNEWLSLMSQFSEDGNLIDTLWKELELRYNQKSRHYHNFSHIYKMLLQLEELTTEIKDLESLKFAIWYHDVIYKSTRKDNEVKSADLAKNRLKSFGFEEKRTKNIKNLIISTEKHELILRDNNDNAILLDLDLSILGSDWKTYEEYVQKIRKEYAIYPNFIYKKGRKKVLQYFLERDTLFFTEDYRTKFEQSARENLKREIELL